ncbi:HAD-IIA family hydrolase [Paenibacillus sp. MBLB4367]|uniref:HAD-IIA family hydrolase n=1 Tax=Paenibacillus sp. MBLB4367 TaxID=3384767 RepID=UPI003908228F
MTRGFVFDLDGTVYLGDKMIAGAAETIRALRDRGDRVVFLTNKPIASRSSYVKKLADMGIPAQLSDVLNSSMLVAKYLSDRMQAGQKAYVIGEQPIIDELKEHGVPLTENSEEADYLILSWDREFTYQKLNLLYQAAMRGAFIVASNPDFTCPVENGQLPDTGTIIAALEAATGKPIDMVVGKPSLIAAQTAVKQLGIDAADCYAVGDRLETDIRMGNDGGMQSVLVLTGVSTQDMAACSPDKPAHVVPSIESLLSL